MTHRRLTKFATSTLAVLLTVYLGIVAYMYWSQERMVFFPQAGGRAIQKTPADVGLAFENANIDLSGGGQIHGWFVAHGNPRATLLYFHGNAGNIGRRLAPIQRWHKLGLSVLIIDYPGFGESIGQPSEAGSYEAARAAWQYLLEAQEIPASEIVIFGRSLGGGVAAQLASEVDAKALILDSTFTSVPDVAAEIYPWLPIQTMMTVRFETKHKLADIDYPVLVLHSPSDGVIPYAHAKRNFALITAKKQFVELQGGHNNAPSASEPKYSAAIDRFLDSL